MATTSTSANVADTLAPPSRVEAEGAASRMESIKDKVAIITGGASGIGLAMARRFSAEGCRLVLADIDPTPLQEAVTNLKNDGAEVIGVVTDVSQRDAVDALRDAAIAAYGKVHILCNNAGVQVAGPMWKISQAKWEWIMGVNLWGVIHGVQSVVPHMIEHGEPSHIINTSSAAGLMSPPFMSAYCVTKHGVVALTECLSQDLRDAKTAIRASVLCPAFVQTNLHVSSSKRPDEAPGDALMTDAEQEAFDGATKNLVESGVQPEVIAEAVYETLLTPRLHILTNPEIVPFIHKRADRIAAGAVAAPKP